MTSTPSKVVRYQGGWIIWDQTNKRVLGYYGNKKWLAEEHARQLEMEL